MSKASFEPKSRAALLNFFVELCLDYTMLTDFLENPVKTAQEFGLSDEDRELLMSRDQGEIIACLRKSNA